jgi:hypothetical protein
MPPRRSPDRTFLDGSFEFVYVTARPEVIVEEGDSMGSVFRTIDPVIVRGWLEEFSSDDGRGLFRHA